MHAHLRIFLIAFVLAAVGGWGFWHFRQASPVTSVTAASSFAPHKALYQLDMLSAENGAGINDVRGEMFYQQDDACDAWTSEHRFNVAYHYTERPPVVNASRYAAWEAKDQTRFYFDSERREDGEDVGGIKGSLQQSADGTAVAEYIIPAEQKFDLPKGYMLPTFQTNAVIDHARRGDRIFSGVMFDGTDESGPVTVNTFIGSKVTEDELRNIAAASEKIDTVLLVPEAWHVRMAIFALKAEEEGMMPEYEMDMILHANGIVSHAIVDYKSFKVDQKLTALESLPKKKC
jgi:hypothetical protein